LAHEISSTVLSNVQTYSIQCISVHLIAQFIN